MIISLAGEKLILSFKYSPSTIAAVKTVPGRMWNPKAKRWEVPIENVEEALGILSPLGFARTSEVSDAFVRQQAMKKLADDIRAMGDVPYTGSFPLYDFQKKGALFLKTMPHALLADVPGLGKSIQTLAALEDQAGTHLILVPASLKFSWKDEIEKWCKKKVIVVGGNKRERENQWYHSHTATFVVANYELLLHDFEIVWGKKWGAVVCDEATRISNPQAETTKRVKLLKCDKKIALTGTPVSNSPEDVYSIIDWLSPKYLGTFPQFRERYCLTDGMYNRVVGFQNLKELSARISRFMLRRTKEEVFTDFPPKTIENLTFDLAGVEADMYENIRAAIVAEIKAMSSMDTRTLGIIPVKMLRLKQCTDHTALVGNPSGESTKLDVLKERLAPIVASGEKAIIFTQFSTMAHILERELAPHNPLLIDGDVDHEVRQEHVRAFQSDPAQQVIIMTEAGAYGLNLQAASYVFHYDLPWSIAKMQQREDRAHRIGNTKPVTVYNLIARDTIDEYVAKVLHKKNKAAVAILDDEARLEASGIDEADIKNILRL